MPAAPIPPEDHILVDDVKKSFGKNAVLHGITMHLRRKETAVIIGGSGAGKTTLLRLLIGLEKPSSGHIWIDGEDIGVMGDYELNLRLWRRAVPFEPLPLRVAHCGAGGLSDAGCWRGYREEVAARHRHFNPITCLPWDALTLARFARKQLVRRTRLPPP